MSEGDIKRAFASMGLSTQAERDRVLNQGIILSSEREKRADVSFRLSDTTGASVQNGPGGRK